MQLPKKNAKSGQLTSVLAANDDLATADILLSMAKAAGSRGENTLVIDIQDGAIMRRAGIDYDRTLADVIYDDADVADVKYIAPDGDFRIATAGDIELSWLLGSLAAFSLTYDWVFVGAAAGCTPDHVRLAGASDYTLLAYDTGSDKFMRAYWMIHAVRSRYPQFDPFILSLGDEAQARETGQQLRQTVRDFLGAPPVILGHYDQHMDPMHRLMAETRRVCVA